MTASEFRIDPVNNWDLPELERHVARLIGRSKAIRLSRKLSFENSPPSRNERGRGGCLYVPKTMTARFLELVGDKDDAEILIEAFQGEILTFTGCHTMLVRYRNFMIAKHHAEGAKVSQLAKATKLTDRQVRRICSGVE